MRFEMIVSLIRESLPDWMQERQLPLPVCHDRPQRRPKREQSQRDRCDLTPELASILVSEALQLVWEQTVLPITRSPIDWGECALSAILGPNLGHVVREAEKRSLLYVPKTFADFRQLAEAFSLH